MTNLGVPAVFELTPNLIIQINYLQNAPQVWVGLNRYKVSSTQTIVLISLPDPVQMVKFHSHPIILSQSVLSLYAKLTSLQEDEKLPASPQRENH